VHTKFRVHAAVLTSVVLGTLVFGSAVAAADGKDKDRDKRTLKVAAVEKQFNFLDLGDPGPTLGDELVFSEFLSIRGRGVGESGVVCVVTQAMPPYDVLTFHCFATLSLRRGQITLQGLVEIQGEDDPGPFTVAITGGTGKYRGACGEAVIRDVSDTRTVYKLRFDDCGKDDRKGKGDRRKGKDDHKGDRRRGEDDRKKKRPRH
jgi:hypothetical protein